MQKSVKPEISLEALRVHTWPKYLCLHPELASDQLEFRLAQFGQVSLMS